MTATEPTAEAGAQPSPGAATAASPLLVIGPDAGPDAGLDPAIAFGRPMLGLTLLDRTVTAARRAGLADVALVAEDGTDAARAALAAGARVIGQDAAREGFGRPAIVMRLGVVPEAGWMRAAVEALPTVDQCRAFGDGVVLVDGGAKIADALAAPKKDAWRMDGAGRSPTLLIRDEADWARAEDRLIAGLVKETDGFMARHFARPLSLRLSRRLARTRITPNQMTLVSLAIGLAAAPFFLAASPWLQAIGGLLFVAHSVIDGCDGELARLKFVESRLGGLLDFWADNLVHVAVFACMGAGWAMALGAAWPLWLALAAVLGSAGSAATVYWLTLRGVQGDGPVYTSVAGEGAGQARDRLTRLLDELSRRDFIYLVFALSLFGKAAWFLVPTAIGAPAYLVLVLVAVARARRTRRGA